MKIFILLVLILIMFFGFCFLNKDQSYLLRELFIKYDVDENKNKMDLKGDSSNWVDHKVIAHGGGSIENKVYTNSIEAFKKNYERGFRLFEIDFLLTSDKKVVARHSWNAKYGQDVKKDKLPLKYDEFMKKKYHENFTPMDFKMVVNLMEQYPDVFIIIDGKTKSVKDTLDLYEEIGREIKDIDVKVFRRFIPQMFYEADLDIIRKLGFYEVLYVVGREEFTYESIGEYCKKNDIKAVSLPKRRTNKKFINTLKEDNILVYTYVLNKPKDIKRYLELGVHGFFSDFISPKN